MNKILLVMGFLMLSVTAYAETWTLPIVEVIDGDTIKTRVNLPSPLDNVSIRISGIDAPESGNKANCLKEAQLAKKATAKVKQLIKGHKTMDLSQFKWDKYGGRIVAVVEVNGVNIGEALIKDKLVKLYSGEKKSGWCE